MRTSGSCTDDGDSRRTLLLPVHTRSACGCAVASEPERELIDGPKELSRGVGDEGEEDEGGECAHLGASGVELSSSSTRQDQVRLLTHEQAMRARRRTTDTVTVRPHFFPNLLTPLDVSTFPRLPPSRCHGR